MDHAWYVRDVHEMLAWRRIGAVAWSFALAALFALAYITLTSTPTLRASAWATRLGVSLAFAATQLPPSVLVAAMLRPSLAPLRVAGGAVGGGVDPWGVFAPPGSEARWAGARAPKHLFPAAFAASRWVSHTPPEPPPDEIARDALGLAALLLSHVAAGAAACALLASAARGGGSCCDGDDRGDDSHGHSHGHHHHDHSHTLLIMPIVGAVSTCALRAARYGAALGAVTAAHWVRGGARLAAFAPVARPRLYRVKRAVAPACVEGGYLACVAVVVAAAVTVLFPMADERFFYGTEDVSGVSGVSGDGDAASNRAIGTRFLALWPFALAALAARFAAAACVAFIGALSHAPLGALVTATALASRAAIETILTERYRFLPQSLDDGAAAACAPLIVTLVNDAEPWAQSLAFLDLCEVCEKAHGEGNAGRFGMLLPHVTGSLLDGPGGTRDDAASSDMDDAAEVFGGNARTVNSPNGSTYARAVAAALAPVLSVASATRAALDAAERAEREAAGRGVRIGRPNAASGSGALEFEKNKSSFERRGALAAGKDGTRLRRGSGFAASRRAAGTAGAETLRDRAFFSDRDDGFETSLARPETSRAEERNGRLETSNASNAFAGDFASTRAGDATASAAWAATADEWGMPSAVAPAAGDAFGAEFGVGDVDASRRDVFAGAGRPGDGSKSSNSSARELTRGFVEDELARRAGDSRRARDGAARARSLSRQMETPCAAAAREAKGVLAAHGQLARWGARAATSLACAPGAGEDAFANSRWNPNAAAVLRVLVAATRAVEACAAAGGGAPSSAASSSGMTQPRCRVPELRDARAACAALADTFRACTHALAESFGAEEARRMLSETREGEDAGTKTDAMDGVSFPEEDGSAPRELVATLETILRSGEC